MRHSRTRSIFAVLSVVVMCAIISLYLLGRDLDKKLQNVATADSDNIQWVLSQIEVEYLVFHAALLRAEVDGTPALVDVRRRFDIFYSRIATISGSRLFADLREDRTFTEALAEVRAFQEATAPVIDGDDIGLLAGLFYIEKSSAALRPSVRALALQGISHFAELSDERRGGVAQTLTRAGLLAAGLIVLLLGASVLLSWLLVSLRRSAAIAEQSRSRVAAVVESSLDAVLVADGDGRILDYNGAAEEVFGFPRDQVVGQLLSDTIVPKHMRDAHEGGMARYKKTGVKHVIGKGRVQLEAVRSDGALFPVELSIASAETNQGEVFVSFMRDITDRLAAETELKEARDQALDGERAKARFLAVVSHEMRTPLNGMLGTLELMNPDDLPEYAREYLNVIRRSGDLLLHHINDVLDISQLDSKAVDVESVPLDLGGLLGEIADGLGPLAQASGNTISVNCATDLAHPVVGDPMRLRQLLFNLVGNAVKFTKNGEISLEAERLGTGHTVELRVMDTGIGISEEDRARVFDDFVTVDTSYRRKQGGTGLGLGIAKRVVETLGGEIGVESEPDEGSLFWVRLPLPSAAPDLLALATGTGDGASKPVDGAAPMNVLVVEDNEINRMITRDMLLMDGHSVCFACDGQEGVDEAARAAFDVILMDISMPRLDGLQATRAIRDGHGPNRKTPIVALTAHALPDEIARFQEAGMNAVLTKPVSRSALIAALRTDAPDGAPAKPAVSGDVDRNCLDQLSDDLGADRLSGLVTAFVRQADTAIAKLTAPEMKKADDGDLLAEIHRLAGAAGTFGAHGLQRELAALETRGKAGSIDEVRDRLGTLPGIWAATRPTYGDFMISHNSSGS